MNLSRDQLREHCQGAMDLEEASGRKFNLEKCVGKVTVNQNTKPDMIKALHSTKMKPHTMIVK